MTGTPEPTPKQVAELLTFLPIFENRYYQPSRIDVSVSLFCPHLWDEQLSEFVERLYTFGLIMPGFNWPEWQREAERYDLEPERLQTAPLDDVLKLLTLHVRKDRFCDGHLPLMVSKGHIAALLHRLAVLYGEGA